ncbi:MAG: helix-turn-helix domain-containing protein [Candidatus Shapirobacteria bacterium]
MKNFSMIPNEIFEPSQLSAPAVLLYCVLIKHCGKDDWCFPGQELLAKRVRVSTRYIRDLTDELINAGLVYKTRHGFNQSNTYKVSKHLEIYRNGSSDQIRSIVPLHNGSTLPTINTYLKGKGKRSVKGLSSMKEVLNMSK